jgi:hypothetical protein
MVQTKRVLRLPTGVFVLAMHRLGTIVVQPGEVHAFEAWRATWSSEQDSSIGQQISNILIFVTSGK